MSYIPIKVPKATLYLTPAELRRPVQRGKAIRRAERQPQREENAREAVERQMEKRLGVFF